MSLKHSLPHRRKTLERDTLAAGATRHFSPEQDSDGAAAAADGDSNQH